jgi:tetratricopeptide (TPR) repeat protein
LPHRQETVIFPRSVELLRARSAPTEDWPLMLRLSSCALAASLFAIAPSLVTEALAQGASAPQQRRSALTPQLMLPSASGAYLAGRTAAVVKDFEAAAEQFGRALARDPRNPELLARTFVLRLAAGRIDEALDLAQRATRIESNDRLARLVVSVRSIRDRRFRAALQALRLGERGNLQDITAGLVGAWAAHGAGDTDEALALLERVRGADWYNVFRDYHGGLIADLAGRRAEASRRLASAYQADRNALRIVEAYARHLARSGERDRALEVTDSFLARVPNNPVITRLAAEIRAGGVVEPVVRDARRGVAEVLFGIGAALSRESGDELAAIYLQLALNIDPTNGLTIVALADLYEQLRQPERVVETYRRVPDSSPMRRVAELHLALALDDMERTDEALTHIDAILARDPNDIEALTTRGNILRGKRRFEEAFAAYDRAIRTVGSPEQRHWTLFYLRGITLERIRRWPEAEADFLRAIEMQPDQPLVLNYLGYSWVDQGVNLERGLQLLMRAVELRPTDGNIIDSVGWAYYRMGNFEEAVRWLERAVERRPADPTIADHLGDAYWRVGRHLEAQFQWRHALDNRPEPEDVARIEAKLRDGLPDEAGPAAAEAAPRTPGQGG